MSSSRINLFNLSVLKSTIDDYIPLYLTSTNPGPSSTPLPRASLFSESNTSTIIRLVLGYAAVAIALYHFYLDYVVKADFKDTKGLTLYAVIAYGVLNGALTLWQWFGEKGVVFEGSRKGKKGSEDTWTLQLYSRPPHKKYEPEYRMQATWSNASGTIKEDKEVSARFTQFFANDGNFVPSAFEAWLNQQVPIIVGGQGASGDAKIKQTIEADEEAEDVIVVQRGPAAGNATVATGADATPGGSKRSRGRPKKV